MSNPSVTEKRREAARLGREARRRAKAALHDEILWFHSFGWSKRRIAERLGVSYSAVEKHLLAEAADRES